MLSLEKYSEYVKQQRATTFISPYELVYKAIVELGFDKQSTTYFENNASSMVTSLRKECWKLFTDAEHIFTSDMLKYLSNDSPEIANMRGTDAVAEFVGRYPEHIYSLSLSNTQSRRSRAGKEFEAIIEFILIGAGIPLDSQGNIGKTLFKKKGLGKLVDLVIPGVVEYTRNKNETILISAKTTLRERWQEVPEEMSRTGSSKMYLVTLDDQISNNVLNILYESNIIIVTTAENKSKSYHDNVHVISFEKLIKECKRLAEDWDDFKFSNDERKEIEKHLRIQKEKHSHHPFIDKYYDNLIKKLQL